MVFVAKESAVALLPLLFSLYAGIAVAVRKATADNKVIIVLFIILSFF